MIYENILRVIGETPVVRLKRIGADLPTELFGKCEFLNPGGSAKDRIALRMVEQLEVEGRLGAETTLIEPTSGNTGIGLAMAAAVKGNPLLIVMPEKMSHEKQLVLEALGATILRTPNGAAYDAPNGLMGVAHHLQEQITDSCMPNQYDNPENPESHYQATGPEIWKDFGDSLDMVVMGVGTGGTLSGVGRYLKERNPSIRIVGVDPIGSSIGGGNPETCSYKVEGIGYDFVPGVMDKELVDHWVYVDDGCCFRTARRLISEEGLLVGGSSGAAVWGMLEALRTFPETRKALVILPDSIRNYLTKFVSDDWMRQYDFEEPAGLEKQDSAASAHEESLRRAV